MQFLPLDFTSSLPHEAGTYKQLLDSGQEALESFSSTLASFISEDRDTYAGLPADFPAYETETSAMNREKTNILKKILQDSNAPDGAFLILDQMLNANTPLSLGKVMSTLSGQSRISPPLDKTESDNFLQFLKKIGFTGDEAGDLLSLTDEGKTVQTWRHILKKIEALDNEEIAIGKSELASLLRGLDISEEIQKRTGKDFSQLEHGLIDKDTLHKMLAHLELELATKEHNFSQMHKFLRPALEEMLKEAHLKQITGSASNQRTDKRSQNREQRMLETAMQKIDKQGGLQAKQAANEHNTSTQNDLLERQKLMSLKIARSAQDEHEGKNMQADMYASHSQNTPSSALNPAHISATANPPTGNHAHQYQEAIFAKIEHAFLQTTPGGLQHLSLQLHPENLGHLNIVLTMQEGALKALIRVDNAETAALLSDQIAELKTQLEQSGIKVAELDVHHGIKEDSSSFSWQQSSAEHNMLRDAQEHARLLRLTHRRQNAPVQSHNPLQPQDKSIHKKGLHLIA